jgi:hypothetical protein
VVLWVNQGKAAVERKGKSIMIYMYDDIEKIAQTIKGKINGSKVNAMRRTMYSDVDDDLMQGTWTEHTSGSYQSTSIVLSNIWSTALITRTKHIKK